MKVNTAIDDRKSTTTISEIPNTAATLKSDTQSQHNSKKVIAYAITVTKDGPFVDGALVLGHAAKKYHGPDYDVDLVAFVAPTVHTSRPILEKFGWKILERQLPVKIEGIPYFFLREVLFLSIIKLPSNTSVFEYTQKLKTKITLKRCATVVAAVLMNF